MSYLSYYHQPPTRVIFLPWRQLFWSMFHPFSVQIDWHIIPCVVVPSTNTNTTCDTIHQSIWIENAETSPETIVFKVKTLPYLEVSNNITNMIPVRCFIIIILREVDECEWYSGLHVCIENQRFRVQFPVQVNFSFFFFEIWMIKPSLKSNFHHHKLRFHNRPVQNSSRIVIPMHWKKIKTSRWQFKLVVDSQILLRISRLLEKEIVLQ